MTATVIDEMRVDTEETVAGDFDGTGEFITHEFPSGLQRLVISSVGVGESEGEGVHFQLYGAEAPSEGSYAFSLLPSEAVGAKRIGLAGQYWLIRPDEVRELFFIDEGELTVTDSNRRYVEGTFTVSGVRWCVQFPNGTSEGCADYPIEVPTDAPRTEASGTFVATPQAVGRGCPSAPEYACNPS